MKIILGLITALAIIFVLYDLQHPEDQANALNSAQIATDMVSRVTPGRYQQSLRIDRVTARHLNFTLQYFDLPGDGDRLTVALDTEAIARAVLAQLVKAHRSPTQEGITISVKAQQAGLKGETGAPIFRYLGEALYDYTSDKLVFNPPS